MMKKIRWLSLLLAALMLLPAASLAAYDVIDFAPEDVQFPLPLTDKPVTLSYWKEMDATKVAPVTDTYATLGCFQELEKLTGVKIEWIIPPIGQETEKFNLMLASEVLPDMVFRGWGGYVGGAQKAIDDGIILQLNDLVQTSSPNMKHLIDNNEEIRKAISTDTGALYVYPYLKLNQQVKCVYGFQLRGDWLAELGLEIPDTIEQWHTVLTAFKEKGTNENGDAILPLVSRKMSFGESAVRRYADAFGTNYDFFVLDGKLFYGPYMPEYKAYLETMRQWYAEGLIDVEFPTSDHAIHDAKVTSGVAGAWCSGLGSGMGKYITAFNRDDSKVVGAYTPILNEGDARYNSLMDREFDGSAGAAISTSCKVPELAAKWLDFQYSYTGHMLVNWGIEGVSYTLDDTGFPTATEEITNNANGLSVDIALSQYSLGAASSSYYQDPVVRITRMWNFGTQKDASLKWNEAISTGVPPLTYSDEESNEYTAIITEANTYRDEMFMKFVLGTQSLDTFDAYLEQLKSIGIERALEIRQAALDRYNSR
ncbi:MAG TPA: extracellular solute-binding protein [Clostridia bacterium]|nr:extracellular solute-binding protein [Clostridia bacterium]